MDTGFSKAQSNNMPPVNAIMVAKFLTNTDLFSLPESRGVKEHRSGRESYGDSAIGFVQIKREGDICTMKCKICPEHKIHAKFYAVILKLNEKKEEIISVTCEDCIASLGGCKHCLAFLMWAHRRSEEPSCTDIECYWKKPKLATAVADRKYVTVDDFLKMPTALVNSNSSNFLDWFVRNSEENPSRSQILKHFHNSNNLNIHQLFLNFKNCSGKVENVNNFLTYVKNDISSEMCQKGCEETILQAETELWHNIRQFRITASKIYEAAKCKTANGALVSTIMGATKLRETFALQRGKKLEKEVIAVLEKQLKKRIIPVGIFIYSDEPIFAASPDGLMDNCVVEIKCPLKNTN